MRFIISIVINFRHLPCLQKVFIWIYIYSFVILAIVSWFFQFHFYHILYYAKAAGHSIHKIEPLYDRVAIAHRLNKVGQRTELGLYFCLDPLLPQIVWAKSAKTNSYHMCGGGYQTFNNKTWIFTIIIRLWVEIMPMFVCMMGSVMSCGREWQRNRENGTCWRNILMCAVRCGVYL